MADIEAPRIALRHRIRCGFDSPVRLSTHWLRLRPAPETRARVSAYSLHVGPRPHFLNWVRDPFENHVARLDYPEPIMAMSLDMELVAELHPVNPFDFLLDSDRYPLQYSEQLQKELLPCLQPVPGGRRLDDWLAALDASPGHLIERLDALNRQVSTGFRLRGDGNPWCGTADAEQLLESGEGSARDMALLFAAATRRLGIATRFCSGYQITSAEPGAYGARMHSWCDVYLPGAGWVGLDPASGLFAAEQHIPLSTGPDPARITPVVGYREACAETAESTVTVQRLVPRERDWPYADETWQRICETADSVDARLRREQIALAQGTRLAFTREDTGRAREWSVLAQGPDKWQRANRLLRCLRDRLLPGGVLHVGQGDWYGGEQLPRWRLNCIARADGRPLWHSPETQDRPPPDIPPAEQLTRFTEAMARVLGLPARHWIVASEDALHARAARNPDAIPRPDPEQLRDPEQRRRLAMALIADSEGAGYVLPLGWDAAHQCWRTAPWRTRRERLCLVPGESSMGFRLPLNELPVAESAERTQEPTASLWRDLPPLPEQPPPPPAAAAVPNPVVPGTAVCAQCRDGVLFVFLPPCATAEQYLGLIEAVQSAAAEIALPVMIEGYEPPPDPRLKRIVLEPETGILHATLPPLEGWRDLTAWLETVHACAGSLGLVAGLRREDGGLDGVGLRSVWTLGGPRPADSPWLQRPALLRSLIRYWQRHPALSYLFAGTQVGPDSLAPRPDEGREQSLYELSVALERLPEEPVTRPWLADRVLSALMVDDAGDPARAEIRVDALYAAGDEARRLGQIAVQSFAPAVHPRLAAVLGLLLRGIVAHVSARPEHRPFYHWGTALHDRYMLPRVLRDDLRDVLAELRGTGHHLEDGWFDPWIDNAFPELARFRRGDLQLTLRPALEPWPLLAEQGSGGAMVRFLDPAMSRVEVELRGYTPGRHRLLCNGRAVPLQPTGVRGEAVAGVRCKVFEPPSTLYPMVAPVELLRFELLDRWTGERLGGVSYYPPVPAEWRRAETQPAPVPAWAVVTGPLVDMASPGPALPRSRPIGRAEVLPLSAAIADDVPDPLSDPDFPFLLDLGDSRGG